MSRNLSILFSAFSFVLILVSALYGPSSDVILADDKNFKDIVLKDSGVVIVEFFAPWCGHCKTLAPEYEKSASVLKGVVKVVAVDATNSQSLAQKYSIQGFPAIKVFGQNKRSPIDYQGQRTSDAIVTEGMKAANQLVKDRKKGPSASGSSSGGGSSSNSKPSSSGSSKKKGSEVIELTEVNFNALVLESNDLWLVEFFAPWCGHCKNLAPEWEEAAKKLKGSVKLGAVDATVHANLAQQYDVRGYPTIKMFPAGPKKRAVDYNGPREAPGIVEFALQALDAAGVPPTIHQLTKQTIFDEACNSSGKICAIMFVPHIYDSSASQRNGYIEMIGQVAKSFRGKPLTFIWSEGTAQPDLEHALEVNFAYPSIVLLSMERKVYAVQRASWSLKNVKDFINGVLSGSETKAALTKTPTLSEVALWDGKDAAPPADEIPLDDLLGDD